MSGFAAEPGALAATSPAFHAHGDGYQAIHDTLRQAHQAEGDPYGTDPAGQMFRSKIQPPSDGVLSMFRVAAYISHYAGDGAGQHAANYLTAGLADKHSADTLL